MNRGDHQHDDLLDSAIAELRSAPPPDRLGMGLESEVISRISASSRAPLFPFFRPVMATLAILLVGVGLGLTQGVLYERQVEQRFEEAYVASIHPIVGVTTGKYGD